MWILKEINDNSAVFGVVNVVSIVGSFGIIGVVGALSMSMSMPIVGCADLFNLQLSG